jgi:hypothetical protein
LPSTLSTFANAPPLLPDPGVVKIWLSLGWSVVLAAAGWTLASVVFKVAPRSMARYAKGCATLFAALLALWCWLPAANGASFWFGLAFQSPSLTTVVCCGAILWANLGALRESGHKSGSLSIPRGWRIAGVFGGAALGWILLLDTLGFWPVSVYRWGDYPAAAPLALLIAGLLWVATGVRFTSVQGFMLLAVAVMFILLRLPTGNLWDALLDPLLWVALNVLCVRWLWCKVR